MTTVVIGNVPPPVDGAGRVTSRVVEMLRDELSEEVELFDCFDGQGRIWREIVSYGRSVVRLLGRDVTRVYIQGVQGERMLFVLLLIATAKLVGTPVVHHHHAFKFIISPSVLWKLICSRRFNVTHVVLSAGMGEALESTYGNPNWHVVSNAAFVGEAFLSPEAEERKSEEIVVLFAGAAGLGKGEDTLVNAIQRLRKDGGLPIKLILAGRGHKIQDDFVETVGVLPSQDLARLMRQSTVLALPSRYEPEAAPMVLYEAAACGLASVASGRGCIPEMRDELCGGLVVSESDVNAVAEALRESIRHCAGEKARAAYVDVRDLAIKGFLSLFGQSEHDELKGVVVAQLLGMSYRSEVFGLAADKGCKFVWGDVHFEPQIVTPPEMFALNPNPAENIIFGRRKLAWQKGTLGTMIRARVLVIEGNPRWVNTYLAVGFRRVFGKPTVFWGHFGHHGQAGKFRRAIRQVFRKLPDRWMAYTESEAAQFRKLGLKAEAAPNPLPPCADPEFSVSGKGEDLLFLGRMSAGKKLDELLQAVALMGGPRRLHVVGDGPLLPEMRELAVELRIQDQVDFYGHLPCGEKLHSIMERCGAIVIPSYVGLNLPQAMAHGLAGVVNPDEVHSPEIEVAGLYPKMIVSHSGSAEGIEAGIRQLGEVVELPTAEVSDRYSKESWLGGLIKSTAMASGSSV